ncbi:MAG: hypothetical protein PHC83_09270, partial [Bacteroidales bacterium]|nr:hypothetical protein [Bacteroidales bacterium]
MKSMQLEDVYTVYRQSEVIKQIREEMQQSSPVRLYISGLCGSSKAIVAKVCAEMNVGMHFFIFPDKETAAFFYHDMEQLFDEKNLDFSEKRCLFFPSSYRKSYPFEDVESYNVLLRTRVL